MVDYTGTDFSALAGGMLILGLAVILFFYILTSLALMKIADRTKTKNSWLAWIPIANVFLMVFIARKEWFWALGILLIGIIPVIGSLASLVGMIYIWWLICERRKKHGALSLLMLIPLVNIGFMLYLAYSK